MTTLSCDICVIGAGSGGLSVAAGASQMGADTVLIERGEMGGECLNTGCVPSKALLAAAHAAESARTAHRFGVACDEPRVDWGAVNDHVRGVIGAIAPHDSQERFEGLGVRVIRASARFSGPRQVSAGECTVKAKRIVIATGSSPALPEIPGLAELPFFTNENLFHNREPIGHLLVIGGGPIGLELAQAHRRLGARVTVLVRSRVLPKDDPELAALVRQRLEREGVAFHVGLAFLRAERDGEGVAVTIRQDGEERRIGGSHLLVATGRQPNIESLDLAAAGIAFTDTGIPVDARLRTSNRRVFAIGDVAGPYQFTHQAGYQAGIVIRNALFRLPAKADYSALPWVTYTDPELAQVGLAEAQARARLGDALVVLRKSFSGNDRARAEGATDGLLKVLCDPKGRILGASMAGPHAGELIQPWILAISQGLRIGAMAGYIAPYPTLGEINKGAAGSFYTPKLFGPGMRRLVRWLQQLG